MQLDGRAEMPTWTLRLAKCADYILTPMAGGALVAQMRFRNVWHKVMLAVLGANAYNSAEHRASFSGAKLFSAEAASEGDVSVSAVPRSSTWGKIFDFADEGITESNYQAYTYDFTVTNNTKDQVADFFDAMNTNRVYRGRLTREKIISELEANRGTQFDPKITDIMLDLLRSGRIEIE